MCARFDNLRTELRDRLEFPNGLVGSPKQLEERFGDISPQDRGRLSNMVMSSIPVSEQRTIREWVAKRSKREKADPATIELLVFYAAAHATEPGQRVQDTVSLIVSQRSAGVIVHATA